MGFARPRGRGRWAPAAQAVDTVHLTLESARARYRVRAARRGLQQALATLGSVRLALCEGELDTLLTLVERLWPPRGTAEAPGRPPAPVRALIDRAHEPRLPIPVALAGLGLPRSGGDLPTGTDLFLANGDPVAPALSRAAGRDVLGRRLAGALLPESVIARELRAVSPDAVRAETAVGVALRASAELAATATRLAAQARALALTTADLRPVLAQQAEGLQHLAERGERRLGFQDRARLRTALDLAWAVARLVEHPLVDPSGRPVPARGARAAPRARPRQNIIPQTM
ncbi:MAG: hypothetical protein H6732_17610 [Alphaproteobacteria bacterium]|nr:hypothetical protein [Alphaproteobacteria bacterium]